MPPSSWGAPAVHPSRQDGFFSEQSLHALEIACQTSGFKFLLQPRITDREVCRAHHQTLSSNQDPSLDPNSKELNRIRWDQTEPARGGKACKTCSIALDDTCCDERRRLSRPVLARRLSWGSERLDSDRGQFIYDVYIYDVCNSMIVF